MAQKQYSRSIARLVLVAGMCFTAIGLCSVSASAIDNTELLQPVAIKEDSLQPIGQSVLLADVTEENWYEGTSGSLYYCYADGTYTYNDMDELIDVCVKNMVNESFTEEQARTYLKEMLPKLDYWKRYDELSDNGQFEEFKKQLINEINDLHIDGLPRVDKLNALVGKYVNLKYTLPNGQKVKFLDDQKTCLGNQLV